jgi:hypothetical protein
VPVGLVALAGSITLATPAFAASGQDPLPVPTTVCGTGSPSAAATPSAGDSTTPASGKGGGASKTATAPGSGASTPAPPPPPASSPADSSQQSASPSPSASTADSSSGGFWGWLNGVWTWITGALTGSPATTPAAPSPSASSSSAKPAAPSSKSADPVTKTATTAAKKAGSAVKSKATAKAKTDTASTAKAQPEATPSCIPSSELKKAAAPADSSTNCTGTIAAQKPWHLSTPSMTMYDLTYNGVTTARTYDSADGKCDLTVQVLDFTAQTVTIQSMVTYSHQPQDMRQYVNGGENQTVTLTGVHLQTESMNADVEGLLNLTFTPTSTPTQLLGLLQGLTIPLPLTFTNVNADNAFLNTQSITINGFDGHGGPDS